MFLKQFAEFNSICIQCHDSPDADAMGAAFGLYAYFMNLGKKVKLIYAGEHQITKPSLKLMVEYLGIPIRYVNEMPEHDILITVDCQYEGGNITSMPVKKVAMVDHHPICVETDEWCFIFPEFGSCCTVVWELLLEAGYPVNANWQVATALYYGLYSDTSSLSEIYYPADRQMRDSLQINRECLDEMIHANLQRQDLEIAGEALSHYYYDEEKRFALLHTKPCDPNLLGVISDMVNCVATVDCCVIYNETPIGYKMSVRSAKKNLPASDLAEKVSCGIGAGGGHTNKAGGMLMKHMLATQYPGEDVKEILIQRIREFIREAAC